MLGEHAASGPKLDLHEIQATVLRQRPAPYFGTHVLLRVDEWSAPRTQCAVGGRWRGAARSLLPVSSGRRRWPRSSSFNKSGSTAQFRRNRRWARRIVGLQEEGANFTIPKQPVRRRVHGIETFNVLRGGEYFFMPSLSALRCLGELGWVRGARHGASGDWTYAWRRPAARRGV